MKTTIDIAGNILDRGKELARREKTTLRDLVEQGLEMVLEARSQKPRARVRPVTVGGKGLTPEYRAGGWFKIRDAVYKGRGA